MTMRMLLLGILLYLASWATAMAADVDPHTLVYDRTQAVLSVLKEKHADFEADPQALYQLVQNEIVPLVDIKAMAMLSIGPPWRNATSAQRDRFVDEFRTMLVRTYTTSLLEYVDAEIEYLPPRSGSTATGNRAQVYTKVKPGHGQSPVDVIYSLRKKDGEWLAYDVSIDGVSLIKNYRTSFSREISETGFDALLDRLAQRNRDMTIDEVGGPATDAWRRSGS